jgi:hypothetical protein
MMIWSAAMSRDYGQIKSSYWTHPDIVNLREVEKMMGAYLLTSEHTNALGCFRLPMAYIHDDFNTLTDEIAARLQALQDCGFLIYDLKTKYLLMPSFLRWNPIPNANSAKARAKEFKQVPSTISFYPYLIKNLIRHGSHWEKGFISELRTLSDKFPYHSETRLEPLQTVSETVVRRPFETAQNNVADNRTEQNILKQDKSPIQKGTKIEVTQ